MTGQTTNAVRLVRSMWPATEPARWSLRRLRHLADIRPSNVDKKSVDGEANVRLCNYTDVYYNDSITSDMSFMPATAPLAQVKRFELRPDDVLVTKDSETPADIAIAAHVRDELPGVLCGYHLAILRPLPHVDGRFLVYALQSRPLAAQTEVAASGVTRFALSTGALADLTLPVPGRAEQLAIADFLDRETAKIDALVAKKQRLVGLLQEKRTALISHAVTKGLDPDVPMKDSGVEWLGQIPQAWNILPIRRLAARVQTGSTPPTEVEAYYRNGELPWFGPGSFGVALQLTAPTKWIAASAAEQGAARVFDAGSTFVVCIGATLGKVGLVSAPSSANQQITAITWRTGSIDPLYGALQMKSLEPLLPGIAPASTLPILDQSKIMELPIVVPPLGQQEQIARWLCAQTDAIDALLAKIREATLRLGEYRSSLVTAAVTGQIDVRTYRREAS